MKQPHSSPLPPNKKRARLQLIMKIVAILMIIMLTLPLLATFNW